jgi:hypothetical protein
MGRFLLSFAFGLPLFAAGTVARYDVASPDTAPFPSDLFTIADSDQKTGRRINLPFPDCEKEPSSCIELNLVNQLDGFSLTARVQARFSAAVDTATLADGLALIALDNLTSDEPGIHKPGDLIKVNRIVYDPATYTVYAKPDNVLDQHRRYAFVVTDAVKDATGYPVMADPAYTLCAQGNGERYCAALAAALGNVAAKVAPRAIVAASVFTTMSATAWLERARAGLDSVPPALKVVEPRGVFPVAELTGITLNQQTGVDPVKLSGFSLPLDPTLLKGMGSIVIGSYRSPAWLDSAQSIAPAPTGVALKAPDRTNDVFFNLILPESPKPQAGYPVVIFGHGLGDSRFGGPTAVASTLTSAGFAVLAINAAGHGFGPESTVTFSFQSGDRVTLRSGGRSVDLNGDGKIEGNEGCALTTPVAIGLRDCLRQTVVDLMQLTRAVRAGIDLDGDGFPDLDASRLFYGGQSLGGLYGTIFNALEPGVRAATLNVGGGTVADIARTSPSYHGLSTLALGGRTPSLLNKDGSWDDDSTLRDKPVRSLTVPGGLAIQSYFEIIEWLGNEGDPIAFAPHLKTSPLAGAAPKPVLFQFALGDRTVPNPANSALIRAADMRENAWMYRHDRALAVVPDLPANPHPYLVLFVDLDGDTIKLPSLLGLGVSAFAQGQMANFFAADGAVIPDPNNILIQLLVGAPLFEVPEKLPEDPGF